MSAHRDLWALAATVATYWGLTAAHWIRHRWRWRRELDALLPAAALATVLLLSFGLVLQARPMPSAGQPITKPSPAAQAPVAPAP